MNNNKNHIEQVLTQVIHAQQATERWLPPHLRYNVITLNTKDSSFKRYSMSVEGKKDSAYIYAHGHPATYKVKAVETTLDADAIHEAIEKMAADIQASFDSMRKPTAKPKGFTGRLLA